MSYHYHNSKHSKARTIAGIAAILVIALGGYLVWAGKIAGGKALCEACGREIHPANVFTAVAPDGKQYRTCCPRCGLRTILNHGGKALDAADYPTGKRIPAPTAFYLEGSDIMECCSGSGFRGAEGTYQDVQYDRCMPSLIAFSTRKDAELVRQQHGGRILSFEEARESVAKQLSQAK